MAAIEFTLAPEHADDRWDRAIRVALVARGHDASVREIRAALAAGDIRVDGGRVAPGARATAGARIEVTRSLRSEARIEPDAALAERVTRIFEDDAILALAKPSGVPTTPVRPDETGTLLHAAVAFAEGIADAGPPLEGGAVHRLDTATSGVVVFAKSRRARSQLRHAFREHRVEKVYDAIVDGDVELLAEPVTVTAGILQAGARVRVGDGPDALPAISAIERGDTAGVVRVTTRYGRRHQVRVHLAHVGLPIRGDTLYGGREAPRLALHARRLVLEDGLALEAPWPEDLRALLVP